MTDNATVARTGGFAGLIVGLLGVVSVPLYFVYSGPPPAWNVLTRNLITILIVPCVLVFFAALRHLLRGTGWYADLMFGCAQVYAALVLVATSLEAGPAIADPGNRIDPTTTGPLAVGDILLHGSATRAITALMLGTAAYAMRRGGVLPRWVATTAFVVAAANVACIPSLFFGADAASFYTALGWGNSALTASLLCYWAGATGLAMLRVRRSTGADSGN
ncbi:MAG TPA: hypothetical protein VGJ28_21395 [Micromonosporaceae bacterium]